MPRVVRIHEGLKTRSPPLRKRIRDLPLIIDTCARELVPRRCQALIETRFEAFDFVFIGAEVVARSSEVTRQSILQVETIVRIG